MKDIRNWEGLILFIVICKYFFTFKNNLSKEKIYLDHKCILKIKRNYINKNKLIKYKIYYYKFILINMK